MDFSLSTIFEHFTIATWCVSVVLTVMSVVMVAVALNRWFHFVRARNQSLLFARTVADSMEKTNVDEVLANAKDDEFKFSYLSHIVTAGLSEARDLKQRAGGTANDLSTVQSAMERAVADEHDGPQIALGDLGADGGGRRLLPLGIPAGRHVRSADHGTAFQVRHPHLDRIQRCLHRGIAQHGTGKILRFHYSYRHDQWRDHRADE